MAKVGDIAPDFTLQGVSDGEISEYTLSDYTDDGAVVLTFYVFDFSPVCTPHTCDVSELDWLQFEEDVSLFGISPDGPYSHMKFQEEHPISYPLLCDTTQEVGEAYDVLNPEKDGFKRVHQRSLFLIGENREVQYRWVANDNWDEWSSSPLHELRTRLSEIRA